MIEDELRVAFARHEDLAPPAPAVAAAIDAGYRRRRRWQWVRRGGGAALAVVALLAASVLVLDWRPAGVPAASPGPSTGPGVAGVGTAAPSAPPVSGKPLNILVTWVDDGAGSDQPGVVAVHLAASGKRAYLVPVGVRVKPATLAAQYHRGGIAAAGREAARELGGPGKPEFDGAVAVTSSAVAKVITAMGGFTWCPAGKCEHFTGPDAIDFLRHRPPGEALSVALRVLGRLASITDPYRLGQVLTAGSTGFVIDPGNHKLADLVVRMRGLGQLVELTAPASAAEAYALFAELFTADADADLSSRASRGGD